MMRRTDSGDDAFDLRSMFERMNRQFEEMNRQFAQFADTRPTFEADTAFPAATGQSGMQIDVAEHDDEIVVTADLPGFERDEIDLSVAGDALTIRAEHDDETEEGSENYVRRERRHRSVHRTIPLPADVRETEATASHTNGVLTVRLPTLDADEDDDSHHIDIE